MKRFRLVTAIVALVVLTAACGGKSAEEELLEQILESGGADIGDLDISGDGDDFNLTMQDEDGNDINISGSGDDDEFSMTIEGDDGDTFVIGGGELPDGLITPVADGGSVGFAMSSGDERSVNLTYPEGSFESLVEFYDDRLDLGGDNENRYETSFSSEDGTFRTVGWNDSDGNWVVTVADCFGLTGEFGSACVTIFEDA